MSAARLAAQNVPVARAGDHPSPGTTTLSACWPPGGGPSARGISAADRRSRPAMSRRVDGWRAAAAVRRGGTCSRAGAVARAAWRAVAGFPAVAVGVSGDAVARPGDAGSRAERSIPRPGPNWTRRTPASPPGVRAARANRSVGRLGAAARAAALAVLALAALALAVPERAEAQTTLVSNIGQSGSSGNIGYDVDATWTRAQRFMTGDNESG